MRVKLVMHEVAGLSSGAYHFHHHRHALVPAGAAPGQDMFGDAAVAFVLLVGRASFAAGALGPARSYGHALLEADAVDERVYLEAAAHGPGTCGVGTFYDDEAAALVGVDSARAWVVHFAAMGASADTPA